MNSGFATMNANNAPKRMTPEIPIKRKNNVIVRNWPRPRFYSSLWSRTIVKSSL